MTSRITIAAIAIALVSASACKSKGSGAKGAGSGTSTTKGPKPASSKGPPGALVVSTQVVPLEKETNLFVAIDARGALSLGVVPAGDRDAGAWKSLPVADHDELKARYEVLRYAQGEFRDEAALIELLTSEPGELDELVFAEDSDVDPPPPPPPPPEEEEASGEAMALDEGKMGEARSADQPRRRPEPATAEEYVGDGAAAIAPVELREALSGMVQKAPQEHHAVAIVADAKALAMWLFPTVSGLRATAIAVVGADGKVGRSPLRLNIESSRGVYEAQTERLVDLSMDGVIVRSGPGALHGQVAWTGEAVDSAAIATAWQAAAEAEPDRKDVFVSVAEGVTVGRLMSVVDALIGAGAEEISLRDWTRPALQGPLMTLASVSASGGLDRGQIRNTIRPLLGALKACYADEVAKDATLTGQVTAQFYVTPKGAVTKANADGVSKAVSACVKKLFEGATFPTPKGGAGGQAQVTLAFVNLR